MTGGVGIVGAPGAVSDASLARTPANDAAENIASPSLSAFGAGSDWADVLNFFAMTIARPVVAFPCSTR